MMHRLRRRPLRVYVLLLALVALGGTLLAVRVRVGRDTGGMPPLSGVSDALRADSDARTAIQIDGRRQQLIGVRTARVARNSLTRRIRAGGTVRYDDTRLTDVNLKLDGWVRDVYVSFVGQRVRLGQSLFTVYSPELDAVQANLISALKARDQPPIAQAADGSTHVDRLVETPRQRLKQWDVADEDVRVLERTRRIPPGVVFRSPMNGVVIEKTVMRGMHVEAGQTLYRIADLSVVLVEADFRETDADSLKEGARVEITLDALPGSRFAGRILGTYPYLSEQTRTLRARVELPNRDGRLKPGMYASVELSATSQPGLLVPADAVVDSGSRQIVFVAQGDGYFEPRQVTVGAKAEGQIQILDGLGDGEEIATRATFFLDSESQMRTALQDYETQPLRPASAAAGLDFAVQVTPNPPRTGDNVLEVRVTEAGRRGVTDVELQVRMSMPAMPAMNMPAMRSDTRLMHVSGGTYRGSASLSMAGRWDLTITARRQGRAIGTRHATLLVR